MDLRLWLVSAVKSVPHIRCCVKAELMIVTEEGERKFTTSFAPNSIKTVRQNEGEPQAGESSAAPKPGATRREAVEKGVECSPLLFWNGRWSPTFFSPAGGPSPEIK